MKNHQACNGCKKEKLVNIASTNFHICKNCLLVSTKVKKNYFSKIKKDFRSNKIYDWNQNRENLDKRSNKNYFFFEKIFNYALVAQQDRAQDS